MISCGDTAVAAFVKTYQAIYSRQQEEKNSEA